MKRLLVLLMLLAAPCISMAAMTCVDGKADATIKNGVYSTNKRAAVYYVTCTVNTTPATAVALLPDNAQAAIDRGFYVYRFATIPGATGPTDNSDLQILDGNGLTILAAAGNGANIIDETAKNSVIYGDGPTPGSTNHSPLGYGSAWTLTMTNDAVNNSSFTLMLQLIREGGDNR